jgi:hypothetical protein
VKPFACRNCRRPLHWQENIGWLHGELPQYAHEPITCERAEPVCSPPPFAQPKPNCAPRHLTAGPDPSCPCTCHQTLDDMQRRSRLGRGA